MLTPFGSVTVVLRLVVSYANFVWLPAWSVIVATRRLVSYVSVMLVPSLCVIVDNCAVAATYV